MAKQATKPAKALRIGHQKDVPFHPVADLFPMMSEEELIGLTADIAANGLFVPIFLANGMIADGRNRYKACTRAGVEPSYREWDGKGSLVSIVVSLNLKRRHLNESQRAMVAAKIANMERGRPDLNTASAVLLSQSEASKLLNVSTDSISRAAKVQKHGIPELAEQVKSGDMSVTKAARIASLPKPKQKQLIKSGRRSGKKLILRRIAKSLEHTKKGCADCPLDPDFPWTGESVSSFAQKAIYSARISKKSDAKKYGRHFGAISEEIEEDNLAGQTNERYKLILNAIDAGVSEEGDKGIREKSDLQRVTKIPWPEFNHTVALMLDLGMISAVQQGGKTDMARGARKTLFKRAEKPDQADLCYEIDDEAEDIYLDRWE